jgi:hypothetical protein
LLCVDTGLRGVDRSIAAGTGRARRRLTSTRWTQTAPRPVAGALLSMLIPVVSGADHLFQA